MESNKFEEIEKIETEEKVVISKPELKEYEKLLLAERNRQLVEKAGNLIKYGCFNQVKETVVDFNKYEKISEDKFMGKYDLYQNNEDFSLVYICPLIENNVGDENERKNMKPYAYDCIYIESMDQETYDMVIQAGKNNVKGLVNVLHKAAFVSYIVMLALTLYVLIYQLVAAGQSSDTNFFSIIFAGVYYSSILIAADVIALPLLVLMNIKYKKYMDK